MSRKKGFSLGEVLVAVTIIAVLTAVLVPSIMHRIKTANATALRDQLLNLNTAIYQFRQDVGKYPSALSQLTTPITTSDQNSCYGATTSLFGSTEVSNWKGPYLSYPVSASGIQSADGAVINSSLTRSPLGTTTSQNGSIIISVDNVERDVAWKVDSLVDPPINNLGNGVSRHDAAVMGTLTYYIAVRGC